MTKSWDEKAYDLTLGWLYSVYITTRKEEIPSQTGAVHTTYRFPMFARLACAWQILMFFCIAKSRQHYWYWFCNQYLKEVKEPYVWSGITALNHKYDFWLTPLISVCLRKSLWLFVMFYTGSHYTDNVRRWSNGKWWRDSQHSAVTAIQWMPCAIASRVEVNSTNIKRKWGLYDNATTYPVVCYNRGCWTCNLDNLAEYV